jgi:Fe(3+) dicitrate transport protein
MSYARISLPGFACLTLFALLAGFPASAFARNATPPAPRSVASPTSLQEFRVVGVVVSTEGSVPLSGVEVRVDGRSARAVTDDRGSFSLVTGASSEGTVTLVFSRLGFEGATRQIRADEGGVTRVEMSLAPQALALEPVAVLLERTRMVGDPVRSSAVPGSAFVLGEVELTRSRHAFDNVHDILRQVPGVNVQDEEGYGLRPHIGLRGAGAERSGNVTLMEDGVLIAPAPYSAPAAYYFPAMGRMEGVEVRKGAAQVRYGPRTLGGAVNLVTTGIPDRRSWSAELSGGGDAMLRAQARAGDRGERHGWMVQGLHLRTDGFKDLETGGPTGFDTRDLLGRFRLNTAPDATRHQELELKVGLNDHSSDETYLGLTEADFRATPRLRYAASQRDVINTEHRQLQLRYFVQPTPSTDLVVTAYRNAFARNWYKLQSVGGLSLATVLSSPESYAAEMAILRGGPSADNALRVRANNREYLSVGVQASGGLRFNSGAFRHALEAGVRVHADDEDRFQWEDGYRMDGGVMVRTSEGSPGSQDNRLTEARAVAIFVQDEVRAGPLALTPGLRYETIDFTRTDWERSDETRTGPTQVRTNSVSALIPGLGVSWEFTPRTHFFGGVHRGFGPPGAGDSEETRVEESLNWEAGVRVRRPSVGANFTAFHSDYANILGRATLATGESGSGELFNGGAVRISGIETAVDAELGRVLGAPVRIPARASWTWSRGVFESDFQSSYGPWGTVTRGDRLPYLPEHSFSGHLGVDDGARTLMLTWHGASAMRTEAGSGAIDRGSGADGFVVLNLRGDWKVGDQGTIFAGIQNLEDRAYVVSRRPAGARPGLPRTLYVGFRVGG